MKQWVEAFRRAVCAFTLWRVALSLVQTWARYIFPLQPRYMGVTPWTNFDGIHYLSIAWGYGKYQQAFFPLYPILIRLFNGVFSQTIEVVAIGLSHIFFLAGLICLYKLLLDSKLEHPNWTVALLLTYPMSFFFAAAYTSSMYFFLSVGMFLALHHRSWIIAGLFAMLASATQLFGVFLLVPILYTIWKNNVRWKNAIGAVLLAPLGLIMYMTYLWYSIRDPLAFVHVQQAFGGQRSTEQFIYLPQVLFRYAKILLTVDPSQLIYHVAAFELFSVVAGLTILWWARKKSHYAPYSLYCLCVIIVPTLTGTFSSIPRYVLSAFPLFFIATSVHNTRVHKVITIFFSIGLVYFVSAYLQGYFVS